MNHSPSPVKRFVLHGIYHMRNYGGEAIVRGTVEILRSYFPALTVVHASERAAADRPVLQDCPIEPLDNTPPSCFSPRRFLSGLCRRLGITNHWLSREALAWL